MRRPRLSAVLPPLSLVLVLASALDASHALACSTTCELLGGGAYGEPANALGLDLGTLFVEGGSYNLPLGTLAGSYECSCSGTTNALVIARDAFRLNAPGTDPVPIDIEVAYTTTVTGAGSMRMLAGVEGGPLVPAEQGSTGTGTFLAHITMVPNASIVLHFELRAKPAGSSSLRSKVLGRMTYHFLGIPANASITSCQGFFQASAVPALASSWGSLKAIYR